METLKLGADAPGYAAAAELYVRARKELAVELGGASCAQLALSAPALFVDRSEGDEGGHHHAPEIALPDWAPVLESSVLILEAATKAAIVSRGEAAADAAAAAAAGEAVEVVDDAAAAAPAAPEVFELGDGDSDEDWEDM